MQTFFATYSWHCSCRLIIMLNNFEQIIFTHISQTTFPCIMAKAVANNGFFDTISIQDMKSESVDSALIHLQNFVTKMNENKTVLSSCAITIGNSYYDDFKKFEKDFWPFLQELNSKDKISYKPDPTVSPYPEDANFSFSIHTESFFILVLHPKSPRWSRRFTHPTIVFNPHKQFEEMRKNGTYMKIRDLIRKKDTSLQGNINPMLTDFGEKSEVFQYLGVEYADEAPVPLIF